MARSEGNLFFVLHKAILHCSRARSGGGGKTMEDELARAKKEIQVALAQVKRIKIVATEKGYQEILGIIEEEV